jgi:D-alanine-D-alanine ligase
MSNIAGNFYKDKTIITKKSYEGKKHVTVLYGGMSCEYSVSIESGKTIEKSLIELGYKVTMLDIGADIALVLDQIKPDIVFNALHGTYGEDGAIQGLLNIMRIPYTHSGLLASSIGFNKVISKYVFASNNIKTIPYIIVNKSDQIHQDPMPRPYVIKPISQGSSKGLIVVLEEDDFNFADYNFEYGDQILIEKYIKGREMQVAVLNGKSLGALEIEIHSSKRFYDFEVKYTQGLAKHIMPANLSQDKYKELLELSEKVFKSIGARGLARVEFIFSEISNEFFILEINTHPGFTELSICPEIASYQGITLNRLVEEILQMACYDEC